ncbi:hypothetical protein [Formosa sp. Hel1_31_208]|uniref:hypothetical protein n=1 Tax=Formosa sp. Hel1_31_208 TaxID=1798225 RepID=UPI000B87A99A|nr:hypothetical protein [Formosa sp. Hel1_31_208]
MKQVLTILGLLIATVSMSYAQDIKGQVTMEDIQLKDLKVSVTVDSAKEVEAVFDLKDIKALLGEVKENEDISFEIICNGNNMSNGAKSTLSYSVTGNTKDINGFLKSLKKIRKAAIKYYQNK